MEFSWLANPFFTHLLLEGLINTLILIAVSGALGFGLALILAISQISGPRPLAWSARSFSTVIRGTPLLLQLFFFYNGFGKLFATFPAITDSLLWPVLSGGFLYGIVAFTINTGAYASEDLRGAFLSVPYGELEAGRAFGLSRFKVFYRIWLPRGIQICLPSLTSEAILLMKAAPLVSTIAVIDLLGAANMISNITYRVYEPLLIITGIYILLAVILTLCMRYIERKFPGRTAAAQRRNLLSSKLTTVLKIVAK